MEPGIFRCRDVPGNSRLRAKIGFARSQHRMEDVWNFALYPSPFSYSLYLSLEDGSKQTEILSQRNVNPSSTKLSLHKYHDRHGLTAVFFFFFFFCKMH